MYLRATCITIALVFAATAGCEAASVHRITILHTNDIHAQTLPDAEGIGGYATIAAYVKRVKFKERSVIVLDAGDQITGSPVSLLWKGTPIYEMMNAIPYDAAALGNHEFDFGWRQIERFAQIADFPLLCANVMTPDGTLLADAPSKILSIGGTRIAVIGVTTSQLRQMVDAENVSGLGIRDEVETVRNQLDALQGKADMVIVLSHCGIATDRRLAREVSGVDLIVGSHDHVPLLRPEMCENTLIVQSGVNGRYMGRLDIDIDTTTHKIRSHRGRHVQMRLASIGQDQNALRTVRTWENRVAGRVDIEIGRNTVRKTPMELSEIIAAILKERYQTDYGYQATGSVRSELPAGVITKRHVWNMLPFGNTIAVIKVEREIVQTLFRTKLATDGPRSYTIATSSFLARKLCDVFKLPSEGMVHYADILREVVIEYVIENGALDTPDQAAPAKEAA